MPISRARDEQGERGFTLVELMVVVLVIAILIAIAIPTFLGAKQRANDRATQANVRNAFTASRVYYNDNLRYPDDPSAMSAVEPSLGWTASALDASSPKNAIRVWVYDDAGDNQTIVVAGRSAEGRCFYLRDVMGGAGMGTFYTRDVSGAGSCPEIPPEDIVDSAWRTG